MADETQTTDEDMNDPDMIAFGLIALAGDARSKAFEALRLAKEDKFDEAEKMMTEAGESSLQAHHQQTALLTKEANGDHTPVDVMLVHAQDHLMTSILAQELISEIIAVRKDVAALRAELESK